MSTWLFLYNTHSFRTSNIFSVNATIKNHLVSSVWRTNFTAKWWCILIRKRMSALIGEEWKWDVESKTRAGIVASFRDFGNVGSLIILRNVLLPLREITIKLQKRDVDLCSLWIDGSSADWHNDSACRHWDQFDAWYEYEECRTVFHKILKFLLNSIIQFVVLKESQSCVIENLFPKFSPTQASSGDEKDDTFTNKKCFTIRCKSLDSGVNINCRLVSTHEFVLIFRYRYS